MIKAIWRISATLKAELRVLARAKIRMFASTLTTALWGTLFILPMILFFKASDIPLALAYAIIAFTMFYLLSTASWIGFNLRRRIMEGILENQLLHGLTLPELTLSSLLIGLIYQVVGLIVFTALIILVFGIPQFNFTSISSVCIGLIGLLILMWGHAGIIGASTLIAGTSGVIVELSSWIIPLASGMIAPLVAMPEPLKTIALVTPFPYPCEALRYGLLGVRTLLPLNMTLALGITAPLIYAVISYVLLMYTYTRIRKRGITTPTLR